MEGLRGENPCLINKLKQLGWQKRQGPEVGGLVVGPSLARLSRAMPLGQIQGKAGAAEGGFIDPDLATVAVDDFGHHRQTYALTG